MESRESREIEMFGETIEEMRSWISPFTDLNDPKELMMYASGVLSDAQQVLERNPEMARQWINKAKYFMREAQELLR